MTSMTEQAAVSTITTEEHPANSLVHDERVQRALRPMRVRSIVRKFDIDAIGVITVSERSDGRLAIIDGQHRVHALIDLGMGDWPVTCRVHHGLTIAREAGLFRRLNNTSKTTAMEDLLKGITEGDEAAVAINKIAARNGLRIATQTGDGIVACASTLCKLYESGDNGPAALGFAINVGVSAWGTDTSSVDGHIVAGLGMLYRRFGEEIDRPALIRKLSKYKGGAPGLLGQAKALRAMRSATLARCVAIIVLDVYNSGRRDSHRLPSL